MILYKIKKSRIDNRGLYAKYDIKKGTKIIEYKGKIITRKQSEEILNLIMVRQFIYLTSIKNMIWMETLILIQQD